MWYMYQPASVEIKYDIEGQRFRSIASLVKLQGEYPLILDIKVLNGLTITSMRLLHEETFGDILLFKKKRPVLISY